MKKITDLTASQQYEIQECIEALYEMIPFTEETDTTWLLNRIRHINENIKELK